MAGINEITVEVKQVNCVNPVYLSWYNKLGGLEHWLFEANYTEKWQTSESVDTNKYISTLDGYPDNNVPSPSQNFVELIRRDSFDMLDLTADHLTRQQMRGLKSITQSVFVSILINPNDWSDCEGDGPIWDRVIVSEGSFEFGDAKDGLFRLSFSISKQPEVLPWQ